MMETTLKIDAMAFGGSAVGTLENGKRCFVRGGVPGDVLRVNVVSDRKTFAKAELVGIETPSPDRIEPFCPHFGICPGCSYQNLSYRKELEWKQNQFERFLVHGGLAGADAVKPPVGAPSRSGWRNKIELTVRDGKRGYVAEDNHTLLEIQDCPLAEKEIGKRMGEPLPAEADAEGKLVFRTDGDSARIVTKANRTELLKETIPGFGTFLVPAGSFFQINTEAFALLAKEFVKILAALAPTVFAELYCGCGTFSLIAARHGIRKVYGAELDGEAVAAAEKNLAEAGLANAKILRGDAAAMFPKIRTEKDEDVLLLVDPPRTGLDPKLCEQLKFTRARHLIYVSCGPDTLARDLRILENAKHPWRVVSTRLFDLFPSTSHFESLTVLERVLPDHGD